MMKKIGFTLAEVLITLGIIGVVAALTAPALVQNTGTAQIGPKLAKAVSTFETANQNLLTESGMDTLLSANAFDGNGSEEANYINNLSNYLRISYYDQTNLSQKYETLVTNYDGSALTNVVYDGINIAEAIKNIGLTKDGFYYGININIEFYNGFKALNRFLIAAGGHQIVADHLVGMGTVVIDINGKAKPNRLGKDVFVFELKSEGMLTAIGSQKWSSLQNETDYRWNEGNNRCDETSVGTGVTCAGSIFENDLKVIYQ